MATSRRSIAPIPRSSTARFSAPTGCGSPASATRWSAPSTTATRATARCRSVRCAAWWPWPAVKRTGQGRTPTSRCRTTCAGSPASSWCTPHRRPTWPTRRRVACTATRRRRPHERTGPQGPPAPQHPPPRLPRRSRAGDRLERGGLHRVLRGADRRREPRRPLDRGAVRLDVAAEPDLRRGRRDRGVAHPQAGQHPMTTLDRYVLREWAKVFFLATFGFPLLVFVIDLADNLEKYTSGGVSKGHLALSYVCYLPETVTLVLPVAVLFAVVFTVGALDRHSELTAAKASGISFHRVIRPLLAASVVAVLADRRLPGPAPGSSSRPARPPRQKKDRRAQIPHNFSY